MDHPDLDASPPTRRETVLARAEFDPKLVHYWMAGIQIALLVTVVGIPLMPVWFIFGRSFHRRQLERLEATLTERSLNIRLGVIFRVEKNVPLDKIQDLTMREGPLLRRMGLALLHVETAGQNVGGSGAAHLVGVVGAPAFRDAVLNQRDRLVAAQHLDSPPTRDVRGVPDADPLLVDIRDTLRRIESRLDDVASRK